MPYLRLQIGGGGESQNKSAPSQQYTFGIKEPKTGGFIGGEFGVGGASARIAYANDNNGVTAGSNLGYAVVPLNIFGGYQWYFYDRPHYAFGIRVRGHIGYTNYNTTIKKRNISLTSNAIQYGAEAQIVWDFLDYMEHTAGLHFAPLGFEGSTFFGKAKTNGVTYDLGSHSDFAFTLSIGLHYYYAINHQVSATYKYRTYSERVNTNKFYSVATSVFMLGYAYKF